MQTVAAGEKWCRHCDRVLPVSSFHRNKRTRDGLSSWCGFCQNEASVLSQRKRRGAVSREEYLARVAASAEARRAAREAARAARPATKWQTCAYCGDRFERPYRNPRKYCFECAPGQSGLRPDLYRKQLAEKPGGWVRTCEVCRQEFVSPYRKGRPRKLCQKCSPKENGIVHSRWWRERNQHVVTAYRLIRQRKHLTKPPLEHAQVVCMQVAALLAASITEYEKINGIEAAPQLQVLLSQASSLSWEAAKSRG